MFFQGLVDRRRCCCCCCFCFRRQSLSSIINHHIITLHHHWFPRGKCMSHLRPIRRQQHRELTILRTSRKLDTSPGTSTGKYDRITYVLRMYESVSKYNDRVYTNILSKLSLYIEREGYYTVSSVLVHTRYIKSSCCTVTYI